MLLSPLSFSNMRQSFNLSFHLSHLLYRVIKNMIPELFPHFFGFYRSFTFVIFFRARVSLYRGLNIVFGVWWGSVPSSMVDRQCSEGVLAPPPATSTLLSNFYPQPGFEPRIIRFSTSLSLTIWATTAPGIVYKTQLSFSSFCHS